MGLVRTILALAVVFAHTPIGYVFVGGQIAVQLFYMISGFLISYILTNTNTYTSNTKFYLSRLLRLFPLYIVVAIFAIGYRAFIPGEWANFDGLPVEAKIFVVISNMTIFGQDWLMFAGIQNGELGFTYNFRDSDVLLHQYLLISPAWTLGVELSFYLIAPYILHNRKLMFFLLCVSILSRGVAIYLGFGKDDPWTYRFFPFELAFFLMGAFSHQILLPRWKKWMESISIRFDVLLTIIIISLCIFYYLIPFSGMIKAPIIFALFFIFLPILFIFQNNNKMDRKIGELSYPIYISHILVINIIFTMWNPLADGNSTLASIIAVMSSIVFSIILNFTISGRLELVRDRFKKRDAIPMYRTP